MRKDLLMNKLVGLAFVVLGLISVWVLDGELSFVIFAVMAGVGLFMDRLPLDQYDDSYDYGDFDELEEYFYGRKND